MKSIAVAIKLKSEKTESGSTDVSLEATASVKLKSGKTAKQQLTCYASQYEFTCDEHFRLKRRSEKDALLISGSYEPDAGAPRRMLGLELGAGDDVFRLDASSARTCEAE